MICNTNRWIPATPLIVLAAGGCTVPNPKADAASGSAGTTGTTGTGGAATSTEGSSSGSVDMGPAPCEPEGRCAPPVPVGWNGPIALHFGPDVASLTCGEGWAPVPVFTAFAGLSAGKAMCLCTCGRPDGGACSAVSVQHWNAGNSCFAAPNATWDVTSCEDNDGMGFSAGGLWRAPEPSYEGGSCTPMPIEEVPPYQWGTSYIGCESEPGTRACEGDATCMPAVPEGAMLCIFVEADVACPADSPYDLSFVVYRGVTDDRGCTECTCSPPQGTCTDATVTFISGNCNGTPILVGSIPANGSCQSGPNVSFDAIKVSGGTPMASCMPTPTTATGSVTEKDPITLCCRF